MNVNRNPSFLSNLSEQEVISIAQSESVLAQQAKNYLVIKYEPLCKSITRKYTFKFSETKDNLQFAKLGLLIAIKNFNVNFGSLGTYATFYIKKELLSKLTENQNYSKNHIVVSDFDVSDGYSFLDNTTSETFQMKYTSFEVNQAIQELKNLLTDLQSNIFNELYVLGRRPKDIQKDYQISRQRFYEIVKIIKKKAINKLSYLDN